MSKIIKIEIISRPRNYEELIEALNGIGITGMTVTQVMGRGNQKVSAHHYRGVNYTPKLLAKVKIEIVVCEMLKDSIISKVKEVLKTGNPGDGKIFIYEISNVIRIRDDQEGQYALEHLIPADEKK